MAAHVPPTYAPDPARVEQIRRLLPELERGGMPPARGATCPRATIWRSACHSRNCPVCGPKWARRQQTKMATNLAYLGGKVATIALTAPGADILPWDETACARRHAAGRAHVHSGRRGCRCQERPLREWCETLGWRWQQLRQAAQLATKRETGERVWILERVWEPQKRGAPHLHMVVPYGTPEERRVADAFRAHLARLAGDYMFGRVQPKLKPIEGREAARYLADYLAGRTSKKSSIRENIGDPRLPKSLLWETPVLSSVSDSPRMEAWRSRYGIAIGTGVTMRTLRRALHLWVVAAGHTDEHPRWMNLEDAVTTVIAFRRIYPKRAGPPADELAAITWARMVDVAQYANGGYARELWDYDRHEYVPNHKLFRDLTELAFTATRGDHSREVLPGVVTS